MSAITMTFALPDTRHRRGDRGALCGQCKNGVNCFHELSFHRQEENAKKLALVRSH